ncbi:MAG: glutaredoxin domain-containing protein [Patescibacteria group bacterium]
MPEVTMYTTPTCGYCRVAKAFFKEHNVAFTEKDVTVDLEAREAMVAKSGQLGVPVIMIDDAVVVGFDKPKLAKLLGIS